ncbi:outer membrane beta-barrel protein [Glaciecola sp. MH2013]|uniref:OmpW family outer membrane protein n=1 Tax=Glaciecola sp. MH2013 TaxID=2785524 RepID=UPI00189D3720|nr:OmpW family outer membrane protein [Glaciecola sp. MH2013]MBF7074682.1 outer membrane beta-barrel protein [Glaciecola sp. MH2013]
MKNALTKTIVGAAVLVGLGFATSAMAHEKGDFVIRGGITNVAPNDDSSNILAGGADLGLGITVDSNAQLGLNFAYFLSDNVNVEVLAATPFTHDVNFGASDPLGTGDALGEVTHLPPSVTANYYFADASSAFQPYVGAGLNFTIFFDEEFTSANRAAGLSDLELDSSFGLTAQVGADYIIDDQWHVNASLRWIDIDTEASFKVGEADGAVNDIQIDPIVFTVSVGYTF